MKLTNQFSFLLKNMYLIKSIYFTPEEASCFLISRLNTLYKIQSIKSLKKRKVGMSETDDSPVLPLNTQLTANN